MTDEPIERPRRLTRLFFARDALVVAPALLGCELEYGGVRVRITETEAYKGGLDPGSHAYRGRTPRTAPMFGPAGVTYVYFSYGMHWMLCLVTGADEVAEAVLVRAGEVLDGEELAAARRRTGLPRDLCRGPARLTQALAIDGSHTARDFCLPVLGGVPPIDLRIDAPVGPEPGVVRTGPRVGVSGPGGDGTAYPWRFWLEGEPTVSTYRPGVIRPRRRT